MSTITLSEARDALIAAGITGIHQSHTRSNALSKIHLILEGPSEEAFGLSGLDKYSASEVLGFLAELTGCDADIALTSGYDTMDPDTTVRAIVSAAKRLRDEAKQGSTLLVATGHPTGMLEHHIRVAEAYRDAGGKILRPREGETLYSVKRREFEVSYTGGVGCLTDWGNLLHTHSSAAMEALLESEPWPDVVLGDHGFAGAAIERKIPTIAVMDINDPALAVAWAEHNDVVIVPMDDNRAPYSYEPSWRIFEMVLSGREPDDDL